MIKVISSCLWNNSKLLLLTVFINVCGFKANAANYYFSTGTGDDTRSSVQAQNQLTPWKTLTKLNAFMTNLLPGDSVLFKRGELFYGSFTITKSGNASSTIFFGAYGTGAKPVISGVTTLNGWVNKGVNTWEAPCSTCGSSLNLLLVNGKPQTMGRYPNLTDPNKGYLILESHVSTSAITDNELTASPNWTGAEVVIRKNHWIIDRCKIQQHSGNTINYTGGSTYVPKDDWGYFFQNDPKTLDKYGEWYYDPATKKILLYTNATVPSSSAVEALTVKNLLTLNNQNYITIDNLIFKGADSLAIGISGTQFINITNCDITFSGTDGIRANTSSFLRFENNTVINTYNNAVFFSNFCDNFSIRNNTIRNTGIIPGAGKNADDTYQAILIRGASPVIEYNTIDSTGYIPIRFSADSALIKNNFVSNFDLTKDDGGGIYTYRGCPGTGTPKRSKVTGNIVLNGIGAPEGTNHDYNPIFGIYMDDNSMNVDITGNTVSNAGDGGIFLHDSHDITIKKNTCYNNNTQFFASYDNCTNGMIRNVVMNDNILFSKTRTQEVSNVQSSLNDISNFGVFDTNYYCRPLDDEFTITAGGNLYTLGQWNADYAKDNSSKKSPVQIPGYTVNNLIGSNKCSNPTLNTSASSYYCSGTNCSTTWDNTGKLDGGSLKLSFTAPVSSTGSGLFMFGVGAVDSSKNYVLRFSLRGNKNNKSVKFYLRQSLSPWGWVSPGYTFCSITNGRTENELLIKSSVNEVNATVVLVLEVADSTVWIDNVQFYEADISFTDPDDHFRFEYNATKSPKSINLVGSYIDARNYLYSGTVVLQPFTSFVLIKKGISTAVLSDGQTSAATVNVYPNPSNATFHVGLNSDYIGEVILSVRNTLGQIVKEEVINKTSVYSESIITLQGEARGVYFLQVQTANKLTVKQLIKLEDR
jgi:parallel beta-helix repeat protein